jgi:hypothetical protein
MFGIEFTIIEVMTTAVPADAVAVAAYNFYFSLMWFGGKIAVLCAVAFRMIPRW